MSKIDRLIQDLCPAGVPYFPLQGLVSPVVNIDWANVGSSEFYYVDLESVDRQQGKILSHTTITAETAPSRARQLLEEGDVLFGTTRPLLKRVASVPAFYHGQIASTGYCVLRARADEILPRFLFHSIRTQRFYDYVEGNQRGASYPAISDRLVKAYQIPVPPLEVQQEIVRILDKFTQLEAELEAELEARQKQLEHYRSELTMRHLSGRKVRLGDVAEYSQVRVTASDLTRTNFVGVDNLRDQKRGRVDASHSPNTSRLTSFEPGYILLGNIRPYLKKIWRADRAGGCSGDVLSIRVAEQAQAALWSDYLYHVLASEEFFHYNNQHSKGAKMPRGDKEAIMRFPFILPTIAEQTKIVGALDKLDALVNDLSSGLPAEIAARRKQYEYYRDRLLSFKELAA